MRRRLGSAFTTAELVELYEGSDAWTMALAVQIAPREPLAWEHWVADELADADKVDILRAYLRRWKAEVGVFFDGVSADSSDTEIAAIAYKHPVFGRHRAAAA